MAGQFESKYLSSCHAFTEASPTGRAPHTIRGLQMTSPTQSLPRPLLLPAFSLARRELVRFLRQRNRIIGALATPIVFWLLIGAGMGHSFQGQPGDGEGNYLRYFYPGTVLMILLFTAIFSTISIIEDRREG